MPKTLEELKVENAKEELDSKTPPQEVEEKDPPKAVEDEVIDPDLDADLDSDDDEDDDDKAKIEDWMQTGEQAPDADDKKEIPNAAWKGAREHFKAKLTKVKETHDSEMETLRAEDEALKRGSTKPAQLNRPKREDFENQDNPDEAFIEALTDYKIEINSAKTAATATQAQTTSKQRQVLASVNESVDQHYERAAKLSKESGITPELYQSADLVIREAIEAIRPGMGDITADALISNLGEGSEKVFYSLGVNESNRSKFIKLLSSDPSGLKAAMYLGSLQSQLAAPKNRKSNAPAPASDASGDKSTKAKDPHKASRKKYDAAVKIGDMQARFDAKMEAKAAGANVKDW